jgi:plastocyanin
MMASRDGRELPIGQYINYHLNGLGGLLNMRFCGLAVIAGAAGLVACAGGDKRAADTAAVAVDRSAMVSPGSTTSPETPVVAGTMAPITGTTHEVKMIGDAKGYRFEPANLTVKQGDGVKWIMVSGGPHNVAFDPATIPPDVRSQLDANMGTDRMGELSTNMKINPGESITISFGNIKPGQYPYHCTPHLALGMKGTITVR